MWGKGVLQLGRGILWLASLYLAIYVGLLAIFRFVVLPLFPSSRWADVLLSLVLNEKLVLAALAFAPIAALGWIAVGFARGWRRGLLTILLIALAAPAAFFIFAFRNG